MNYIYVFLAGIVIGAGVMLFVNRVNGPKMKKVADEAVEQYKELLAKVKGED